MSRTRKRRGTAYVRNLVIGVPSGRTVGFIHAFAPGSRREGPRQTITNFESDPRSTSVTLDFNYTARAGHRSCDADLRSNIRRWTSEAAARLGPGTKAYVMDFGSIVWDPE